MDKSGKLDPKPTVCIQWKATVQSALWPAGGTPSESESGHVFTGATGNLGEPPVSLGATGGEWVTGANNTRHSWADAANGRTDLNASWEEHKEKRVHPRYRKGAKSEPTGKDCSLS